MSGRYLSLLVMLFIGSAWGKAPVDLSQYRSKSISVEERESTLVATWMTKQGWTASIAFSLEPGSPLFEKIELAADQSKPLQKPFKTLASKIDPQFVITTGVRKKQPGNRYIFFDKPAAGATQRFPAKFELSGVKVSGRHERVTFRFSRLAAGPFSGDLLVHLYLGSALVHIEAALANGADDMAYIFDAMLVGEFPTVTWKDLTERMQRVAPRGEMRAEAVRLRTMLAENENGSIALFPPPHAWFFPRDRTDNLKFMQVGALGFGLRQDPAGGGAFVPWFDAPAGKTQRMDYFLFLCPENAEKTLARVAEYTHNDSFKKLDGYLTFTSHWHSRLTVAEMAKKPVAEEFVSMMKQMNVNLVHLAEFHGDGNPDDPGPKRLPQMKAMFELCKKYSDEKILLMPGEEGSKYLGNPAPRDHPGHWMYFFPKPVYLTWVRPEGKPFVEEIEGYGRVYHVGSKDDMVKLLEQEHGLAWTTHPRIKASYMTPDAFKDEPWYRSELWLGAAWKAMPADLSEDRLGTRCLDLLDDMRQWGQRKFLPAEVDVFEIDRTHELYGHMNINYLKMANMPASDDWSSVLDVLKDGEFFSTTGEILIHHFSIDGGIGFSYENTFPLDFAEVIWGDAKGVHRQRIDFDEGEEAGTPLSRGFSSDQKIEGAQWVRLEIWDIARNGAFTQPIIPQGTRPKD